MRPVQALFSGLALIDMDGTLLQSRTIDTLCDSFNKRSELVDLDKRSNTMPAYKVSQEIARFFKCNTKQELEAVFDSVPITRGASHLIDFLKSDGFQTVIVTDSYQFLAERLAEKIGIHATIGIEAQFNKSHFTGEVNLRYPCIDPSNCRQFSICKHNVMKHLRQPYHKMVLAIGDGEGDLCMIKAADIGVAFQPKNPELEEVALLSVSSFEELEKTLKKHHLYNKYRRNLHV